MRLLAFLLINPVLLSAWWWWLRRWFALAPLAAAVYAGLLFAAQLVFSQLLLGTLGRLRLSWLLGLLGTVTAVLILWSVRAPPRPAPDAAPAGAERTFDAANVVLGALALAFAIWLGLATWLLPPRGVDDLAYHLPPLYQSAQTGRIALLPLELRAQFALPLGGGLLFLWPLLFLGTETWVDGVGLLIAVYAALVLFALARAFAVASREALFAALLFVLSPLVMAQAGTNYTDLPVVACHLVLLYAAVRFWQEGTAVHLAMAAVAGGLGLGIKYNMLIAVATVQPILLVAVWRQGGAAAVVRRYAPYLAVSLLLPAYWPIRNALTFGEPLYPYALGLGGLRDLGTVPWELVPESGQGGAGRAIGLLLREPARLLVFLFRDPGLASANGGLGPVFWAFGVPALLWCLVRALRAARAGDLLPVLFWGIAPVTLLLFLAQVDAARLPYNMRLLVVLLPLGLLAFALLLERLRASLPGAAAATRAVCLTAAGLAVMQLAAARFPSFDIGLALADRRAGTATTAHRYYRHAHGDLPSLATALEPLDYLTVSGSGWDVYMAADWIVFMTAPLFGSALQNRVWNFQPEPRGAPDALLYHTGFQGGANRLYYVGERITPAEVRRDARYELLTLSGPTELWVARVRLQEPRIRARLAEFYRRRFATDIAAAASLAATLPPADALVGSTNLVHGFRYLGLAGTLTVPVYLVSHGEGAAQARRLRARRVISVGAPLVGANASPLGETRASDGLVRLYLNEFPT